MRLIDADELREFWLYNGLNEKIYDTNDVLESIDEQPTIDPESLLPPKDEWISVKDRLPVAKEMVLAYEAAFDSMSMAFRLPNTEEFINAGDYYALDAVTHWMPLPEPPKETHND